VNLLTFAENWARKLNKVCREPTEGIIILYDTNRAFYTSLSQQS